MSDPHEARAGRRGLRRGALILSAFVALVAVYLLCWSQAGFPSAWRLIRKGMTKAEVEALTGSRIHDLIADGLWRDMYQPPLLLSEHQYDLMVVFTPSADMDAAGGQRVVSVFVSRYDHFAIWLRCLRDPNVAMSSQLEPPAPFVYQIK